MQTTMDADDDKMAMANKSHVTTLDGATQTVATAPTHIEQFWKAL